jgi:hypothetical protein
VDHSDRIRDQSSTTYFTRATMSTMRFRFLSHVEKLTRRVSFLADIAITVQSAGLITVSDFEDPTIGKVFEQGRDMNCRLTCEFMPWVRPRALLSGAA